MKKENTSIRLKRIMQERNLRQVDILDLTKPYCEKHNMKLNKSDLSQYVSGLVEPGQEKLSVIAMALGVNETWLMGYDVQKERECNYISDTEQNEHCVVRETGSYYTSAESNLLDAFNKLNEIGKSEAVNRVTELTYIPQYTDSKVIPIKSKNRKYIPTEEDIQSLVARKGKSITREQAIDIISTLFSDDDEE